MESGREEVLLVQEEEVFINCLKGERKLAQGTKKDKKGWKVMVHNHAA